MMKFKEFLEESFQTDGSSRSHRSTGKRSASEEFENAKKSPIFQKTQYRGWTIQSTVHAASQARDRRGEFKFDDWKTLHRNAIHGIEREKPQNGEHVIFSKSKEQGYVVHVDNQKKHMRIITTLPKGKHNPKPGTGHLVVENEPFEILSVIEIM